MFLWGLVMCLCVGGEKPYGITTSRTAYQRGEVRAAQPVPITFQPARSTCVQPAGVCGLWEGYFTSLGWSLSASRAGGSPEARRAQLFAAPSLFWGGVGCSPFSLTSTGCQPSRCWFGQLLGQRVSSTAMCRKSDPLEGASSGTGLPLQY